MKKILTLAVMAVACLCSSAQNYIGGSLGVMRDVTDHETSVTIAPEFGYTYNDHWGLGIVLNYTYKNVSHLPSNAFSFNPYVRWTFAKVADDKLGFFLDGGFNFGFVKNPGMDTGIFYNIGFKPGISYTFNEHWCVVTHLGFLGWEDASKDATALGYSQKFGFDFNSMNLNFGLYYTF